MENYDDSLNNLLSESDFLKRISGLNAAVKNRNSDSPVQYRKLGIEEISQLKKQNNHAESWDDIFVANGFITSFIINSRFHGRCLLGRFTGFPLEIENGITLQSGIYDSVIKDSVVGDETLVSRCGLLANYHVSSYTVIYNTGTVTAPSSNTFSNGMEISTGPETGERAVKVFADLNLASAGAAMDTSRKDRYDGFVAKYQSGSSSAAGYIGKNCRIVNTVSVTGSFVSDYTVISGALNVRNSTILSGESDITYIGPGVEISDSIIQWGCSAESSSIINRSLLMEYSHAEKQCIISESILGPNSSIGEAEITSTYAGPFSTAHHHSLIIAAIWPEGKGNIGYGANIGSNHTSRLPDQEIFPGEGMFFGLGSSVKYPADFSKAPYSVISTGAVTLPQKMEFPFSLITQPAMIYSSISPAYNELIPGWVLNENIYAVIRNEAKYRKRNRSHRNHIEFNIFRPEIIDMMTIARSRLEDCGKEAEIYTENEITGTGKNIISEKNRNEAIKTYSFYIHYYALKLLAHRVGKMLSANEGVDVSKLFNEDADIPYWSHAMSVLKAENLQSADLKKNLERLHEQNSTFLAAVYSSREKDHIRGKKIIDDYTQIHKVTGDDQFIMELRNKTVIEQTRLEQIINMLQQ